MSFLGQNRRAWENYGSSDTNQNWPSEDLYYGNPPKVYAAGQLGKSMRNNSNEGSISRLSQVQAWLKDQVTAEDFEKIWRIFLDSTASSSTHTYGGADLLYQGDPYLKDIDLMADIPAQSSISTDLLLTPGLGLSEDSGQYQNYMDPICFIKDFNMNSSAGQTSTFSVISPSEPYYSAIPSRSRASSHSESSNAVEAAGFILRHSFAKGKQDRTRDSVQSSGSYNSMNSDRSMRWSSKHSSASLLGGQSFPSFRKSSQRPMHSSIKKPHSRSSSMSRASNSIPSSDIPCTYPGCTITFTRDPDRARHESAFHSNKVGYTCLLHTCGASCSELCTDKIHSSSYHNARPDKMKEHLEKVHGWSLKQSEIPEAFLHSYERQQRGWVCSSCGENIGSWYDNRDDIKNHYMICTAGLQASFKRMSVEELGTDGARKGGDMEKEWPLLSDQEEGCKWF